jgi:hypothetical protein
MKSLLRKFRETRVYARDFRDRGLDNVKLQIKHANFSSEKDKAARRWIARQEAIWQRVGACATIAGVLVAIAAIYFK